MAGTVSFDDLHDADLTVETIYLGGTKVISAARKAMLETIRLRDCCPLATKAGSATKGRRCRTLYSLSSSTPAVPKSTGPIGWTPKRASSPS
jgi:hypothetical protein